MRDIAGQVAAMLARVPSMDQQQLITVRENAIRIGPEAEALVAAIDARLAEFKAEGGMAVHRLEFARQMMRMVERSPNTQWIAGIDLFKRAAHEYASNPYIVWMHGNSARKIPLTKAIEDVIGAFPNVQREKRGDGQSDRVYFRRKA